MVIDERSEEADKLSPVEDDPVRRWFEGREIVVHCVSSIRDCDTTHIISPAQDVLA